MLMSLDNHILPGEVENLPSKAELIKHTEPGISIDELRLKRNQAAREWRRNNPEKARIIDARNKKKIREADPELSRQKQRDWRGRNRALSSGYSKKFKGKHLEKVKAWYRQMHHKKKSDPLYRLKRSCRRRVNGALKLLSGHKSKRTFELIGCTPEFLRDYLQAQFTPAMSWENHGTYWHVDHIIPLASFDLTQPEQQRRAFHYSNCQPLEKLQNISKSDTLPAAHQPLLI